MPTIRPSSDLRSNYGEISTYCHEQKKPVFITLNGKGDLAVMSIEQYERLVAANELYRMIDEGLAEATADKGRPYKEAMQELREDMRSGKL